jgi:hypothetical protein
MSAKQHTSTSRPTYHQGFHHQDTKTRRLGDLVSWWLETIGIFQPRGTKLGFAALRNTRRSRWYLFVILMLCGLQLTPLAAGRAAGAAAQPSLVTCTINYQAPFSDDMLLVWGVNNWKLPDPALRPTGSHDDGRYAITPMQAMGDHKYATTITVPAGTWIDFMFHTTKPIDVWDGEPIRQVGYHQKVERDTQIDQYQTFVTHEIRYHLAEAGQVYLVWGINGWNSLPEPFWPAGTSRNNSSTTQTLMIRDNDTFSAKVQVPSGAIIDYGFWITKTREGATADIWNPDDNGKRDYHSVAVDEGITEVQGTLTPQQTQALESAASTGIGELAFRLLIWVAGIAAVCGILIQIGLMIHNYRTGHERAR